MEVGAPKQEEREVDLGLTAGVSLGKLFSLCSP